MKDSEVSSLWKLHDVGRLGPGVLVSASTSDRCINVTRSVATRQYTDSSNLQSIMKETHGKCRNH